jgi:hypothetical protein
MRLAGDLSRGGGAAVKSASAARLLWSRVVALLVFSVSFALPARWAGRSEGYLGAVLAYGVVIGAIFIAPEPLLSLFLYLQLIIIWAIISFRSSVYSFSLPGLRLASAVVEFLLRISVAATFFRSFSQSSIFHLEIIHGGLFTPVAVLIICGIVGMAIRGEWIRFYGWGADVAITDLVCSRIFISLGFLSLVLTALFPIGAFASSSLFLACSLYRVHENLRYFLPRGHAFLLSGKPSITDQKFHSKYESVLSWFENVYSQKPGIGESFFQFCADVTRVVTTLFVNSFWVGSFLAIVYLFPLFTRQQDLSFERELPLLKFMCIGIFLLSFFDPFRPRYHIPHTIINRFQSRASRYRDVLLLPLSALAGSFIISAVIFPFLSFPASDVPSNFLLIYSVILWQLVAGARESEGWVVQRQISASPQLDFRCISFLQWALIATYSHAASLFLSSKDNDPSSRFTFAVVLTTLCLLRLFHLLRTIRRGDLAY